MVMWKITLPYFSMNNNICHTKTTTYNYINSIWQQSFHVLLLQEPSGSSYSQCHNKIHATQFSKLLIDKSKIKHALLLTSYYLLFDQFRHSVVVHHLQNRTKINGAELHDSLTQIMELLFHLSCHLTVYEI